MYSLYGYAAASDTLARLGEANRRLAELMTRVRSTNQAFADAARPLMERPELDSQGKRQVALNLRAAERECEDVAQLTARELVTVDSLCGGSPMAAVVAAGNV